MTHYTNRLTNIYIYICVLICQDFAFITCAKTLYPNAYVQHRIKIISDTSHLNTSAWEQNEICVMCMQQCKRVKIQLFHTSSFCVSLLPPHRHMHTHPFLYTASNHIRFVLFWFFFVVLFLLSHQKSQEKRDRKTHTY